MVTELPLQVFSFTTILIVILGLLVGLIFGAVPGLGPPITLALMIPILDQFSTPVALLLLGGTYVTGIYGGSISAILMNVPGTGASACTTFDGYPMSKKGEAITALSISTTSSLVGGLLSIAIVALSIPILSEIILIFGPPEYFLLAVSGIIIIAAVSQGNILKDILSGFFGLMLTTIGFVGTTGAVRYTQDIIYLYNGVQYIPALIGIFAVTEMLKLAGRGSQIAQSADLSGSSLDGIKIVLGDKINVVSSSLIGFAVGIIPGSGGTVANFVAYGTANSFNETKEDEPDFGDGNHRGVVAAEASNNAMVSGSLVPTLTFGIPGNSTTAVMLGALLFLGLRPGPTLFATKLDSVYTLLLGVVLGCVFLVTMYWFAPYFSTVTTTDKSILIPAILSISTLGTYSVRYLYGDLIQMLLFGIFGYVLVRYGYSVVALLLGIILGPIAETNFIRTLQISETGFYVFIQRPISVAMIILMIVFVLATFTNIGQRFSEWAES